MDDQCSVHLSVAERIEAQEARITLIIHIPMIMAAVLLRTLAVTLPMRDAMAALFTKKHRELEGFINASSTALMLVEADTMIHVGKFQTVTKWKKDNHE